MDGTRTRQAPLDPVGDIAAHTARSGLIQLSAQAILLTMNVGGGVILARLLDPTDFGLLAMGGVVALMIANVRDFGFTMAAVHRSDLIHQEVSALFWLTVQLNLMAFAGMAILAPVLAWFFGEPRLTAIALVLAAGTLAAGFGVQHESLLIRRMEFRVLRGIEIGSLVAGLATAIVLVTLGAGYWALVAQIVAVQVLRTAALWRVCAWRPSRRRQRDAATGTKPMVSYALHLTGYRVLTQLSRAVDRVIVGYVGGAGVAGLYANASRWAMTPIVQVFPPLMAVAVSGLSRVREDVVAFRSAWRRGMLPVFSLVIPTLLFLSIEARAAIVLLLGDRWVGAVPFFRILCLGVLAIAFERTTKWLYLAEGDTRRQFRWGLIHAPVMIGAVAAGSHWGAPGVAAGFAIGSWVLVLPGTAVCLRGSRIRWMDFVSVLTRPAAGSALACTIALALPPPFGAERLAGNFVHSAVVFGFVYLGAWLSLPGGTRAARDGLDLLVRSIRPPVRAVETEAAHG